MSAGIVVVTGGSAGVGRATAEAFAGRMGYRRHCEGPTATGCHGCGCRRDGTARLPYQRM